MSQALREREDSTAELASVNLELTNLGHLQQPVAWSYIIIPLETSELGTFAWPEWVTEEEKALFMSNPLQREGDAKVSSQASGSGSAWQNFWPFESERAFSAPLYRSNNKPLTDFDFKKLIQGSLSRRERITHSATLSFVAAKGHLALPTFSPSLPPPALYHALPPDFRHILPHCNISTNHSPHTVSRTLFVHHPYACQFHFDHHQSSIAFFSHPNNTLCCSIDRSSALQLESVLANVSGCCFLCCNVCVQLIPLLLGARATNIMLSTLLRRQARVVPVPPGQTVELDHASHTLQTTTPQPLCAAAQRAHALPLQFVSSSGLKKAHNLLLEIMVPCALAAITFKLSFIHTRTSMQVRATDTELEHDETDLLTNAPDAKKEQLGFLKVTIICFQKHCHASQS